MAGARFEFAVQEAAEGGQAGGDDGDVGFDGEPEAVGAADVWWRGIA